VLQSFGVCSRRCQRIGGEIVRRLHNAQIYFEPRKQLAALVSHQGQKTAAIPFWLYEQGAKTTVTTSKGVYKSGKAIVVSWTNAPGYFGDWLGLYHGDSKGKSMVMQTVYAGYGGGNMRYLCYEYTHGAIEGTATFSESSLPGYVTWPLQPGSYEIRLLLDDAYSLAGSSMQFRVVNG
jgi:hypothetical protein